MLERLAEGLGMSLELRFVKTGCKSSHSTLE